MQNKRFRKFKKGFTLLEVLLATIVFAGLMLIVTATVTQSISYRSKIKALRDSSIASRQLMDEITTDIRKPKTALKIGFNSAIPIDVKSGVAMFSCVGTTCTPEYSTNTDMTGSNGDATANVLILSNAVDGSSASQIHVYAQNGDRTYFLESQSDTFDINSFYFCTSSISDDQCISEKTKISGENIKTVLSFGGFSNFDNEAISPYVVIKILGGNIGGTKQYEKITTNLRTLVTLRNYQE
ncbi:MAG: type II secretion system protein [Candidatus Berkelbacteria bacterium]|nr:type II secretion system protein [Candidatus Berkelbacteria bacterium]